MSAPTEALYEQPADPKREGQPMSSPTGALLSSLPIPSGKGSR